MSNLNKATAEQMVNRYDIRVQLKLAFLWKNILYEKHLLCLKLMRLVTKESRST